MLDRASVTLRMQASPGTYSNVTWDEAWWRPAGTLEAAPSQGAYLRASRSWFLPKETNANVPDVGDLIVNSVTDIDAVQVTWTVLGVTEVGALGAWSCDSLSLELQAGLSSVANITRPALTQDSSGRQLLASYSNVATSVPCKLQLENSGAEDTLGRRTIPQQYTLFLGIFTAVQAKDRVEVGGSNYTILSSLNPNRLEELQELTVEYVP